MRERSLPIAASALLAMLGLLWAAAAPGVAAEQSTFRDLVRKYAKSGDGKTLGKMIGFSKEVQHVVALEYTVLTKTDGKEEAVDAAKHQFHLGDQIRVRIQPVGDTYIYIFHEGASGKRTCLLPTEQEKPPFVKAGQTIELPSDGTFEFTAPPGDEQLLVVATEKPTSDLASLANVVFNKPDSELTPAEKALKKTLKATVQKTLKSIRDRQAETTTYRGLLSEDAMREFTNGVRQRGVAESVLEEPPVGNQKSTFAMIASVTPGSQPHLFVNIPLKSIAAQEKK